MIPVHLKAAVSFAIRGKKWQNSLSRDFAVEGKIYTTSFECSCISCKIRRMFAQA